MLLIKIRVRIYVNKTYKKAARQKEARGKYEAGGEKDDRGSARFGEQSDARRQKRNEKEQ